MIITEKVFWHYDENLYCDYNSAAIMTFVKEDNCEIKSYSEYDLYQYAIKTFYYRMRRDFFNDYNILKLNQNIIEANSRFNEATFIDIYEEVIVNNIDKLRDYCLNLINYIADLSGKDTDTQLYNKKTLDLINFHSVVDEFQYSRLDERLRSVIGGNMIKLKFREKDGVSLSDKEREDIKKGFDWATEVTIQEWIEWLSVL